MDLKAPKNINSSKNRSGIGSYLERPAEATEATRKN